jgi:hypothetical protein
MVKDKVFGPGLELDVGNVAIGIRLFDMTRAMKAANFH